MSEEKLYQTLFSSVPIGLLRARREGSIIEINPVLVALLDLPSPEACAGRSLMEFAPFRDCGLTDYLDRSFAEDRPIVSEGGCVTANDDSVYVRYYIQPLYGDEVQCIVVDLTGISGAAREARRIHAHFDSIVSNISPILTMDGDYHIRFVNRTFEREFGISRDRVEDRSVFEVLSMSRKDEEDFRANVEESEHTVVENCEFRAGERVFGYTIFRFGSQIGAILKDISRIKKLEEKVTALHSRLLHLQERERQVVARELHDGVGQTILAAKLNFTSYEKNPEQMKERFSAGLDLIDRASKELRDLYTRLYPSVLNDLGLEAAIRWYSKHFLDVKGIDVDLEIELESKPGRTVETHLFRIVQELFTNVVKHSGADRVSLHLANQGDRVSLRLEDDGRGFSPEAVRLKLRGFGLDNIRRRVDDMEGTVKITSMPGQGTRFDILVPLDLDAGQSISLPMKY